MNTKPKEIHEVIENAPEKLRPLADLVEWSLNYDWEKGTPYFAFLDLIGYTDEHYGSKLNPESFILDYASADAVAESLKIWAIRPLDVHLFIQEVEQSE